MKIILYKTDVCPRCRVIYSKLVNAGIDFNIVSDIDTMSMLGIDHIPVLEIDGKRMGYAEANTWVNERSGN